MTYVTHTHTHSSGHAATFGYCHSRRLLCPHTHVISHTYVHLPRRPLYYWAVIAFLAHCTPRARLLSVLHTHTHLAFPHTLPGVPKCLPVWLLLLTVRFFVSCLFALSQFACLLLFLFYTHSHTQTDINVALRSNYASPSYFAFGSTKKNAHAHIRTPIG